MTRTLFGILTLVLVLSNASAQESTTDEKRMLVIYDSSNSMWGELADKSRKYEAGRTALTNFLSTNLADRSIGFRAYGHRDKEDCRDSELMVPFSEVGIAKSKITSAVAGIRPTGKTPITHSLREALTDFGDQRGDILLISDGIETCDIDPCDLMREWQAADINVRVHVVGVGLTEVEQVAMACIADTSGGKYFDADSADGLADALDGASVAIEEAPESSPARRERGYALRIIASDDQGRTYIAKGSLYKDGDEVGQVGSHYRNAVEAPGDYELEIGPILRDGSIYEPVRQSFTIEDRGDTTVNVTVKRPAFVVATFTENGEEHRGAHVTAYQDGKEMFSFRGMDEALARPGAYEFRATPNADNELSLTETLVEGEQTELLFELINTIQFYVRYELPDGERFRRGSELWRDGEKVYGVYSGNPTTVIPGTYELRSDDQNLPVAGVEIEIKTDGETIVVPVDAGWITISYAPSDFDYISEPDRAWLESLDRGNSKYARLDTPIPVKPGKYRVNPHTARGFFDPVDIDVPSNETVGVVLIPEKLGEIAVNYAPSEHWPKEPDRASVQSVDGQTVHSGFMRPGIAKKFLPGRYRVKGGGSSSDAVSQEVVVLPHETVTVTLKHALDP